MAQGRSGQSVGPLLPDRLRSHRVLVRRTRQVPASWSDDRIEQGALMCSERSTSSATHFEEEVLPHLSALRRAALSLVREPTAPEDLVQDALLRACRSWHLYQPGTNVRAWLMTIQRH
jgi:hypothetical protein